MNRIDISSIEFKSDPVSSEDALSDVIPFVETERGGGVSKCDLCKFNDLDWYDEPCDSCTMGGETNHFEPIDNRPDTVSRKLYDRVVWERDTAISQLQKLGYGLGEEVRNNEWNNHWEEKDGQMTLEEVME